MKVDEEMDEEEEQEEDEEESDDEEFDEETVAAIKKAVKGKTVQSLKEKASQIKSPIKNSKKSESDDDIELMRVPTQHELAFKIPSGKILSYEEYLVWLGNLVWRIKKTIA